MTEVAVPVFDDLERRKLAEASLRSITLSTSRVSGDEFFRVLVKDLAAALDMHFVIAGELIVENGDEKNRTLAIWAGTDYLPNMTYSLLNTPCSDVAGKDMCFLSSCVQQEYPLDTLLVDMGAESYVGMSMVGTTGATLGILVGMDTKPIDENRRLLALSLLSIFSARCAAELQHRNREVELETQVNQRTRALEAARDMLVQREKLAALGSLVAGVAHTINTPIGNALTTATTLRDLASTLGHQVQGDNVSRRSLMELTEQIISGAELVEQSLKRAADLVTNFRMLADSSDSGEAADLNLLNYVTGIGIAHQSEMHRHGGRIVTAIAKELVVRIAPGMLAQILSNLIMNSLIHGFAKRNGGTISISAHADGPSEHNLYLQLADDGVGASNEVCKRMFEPFFTTRLGQGNSGLGLHLVYTMVQRLNGSITVDNRSGNGIVFVIILPGVVHPV